MKQRRIKASFTRSIREAIRACKRELGDMPRKEVVQNVGVVGLDLSLRCSAAVYLSPDWDPSNPTANLEWTTVGNPVEKGNHGGQVKRLLSITNHISEFVGRTGANHVWLEGYSYSSSFGGPALGELGGCVKMVLLENYGIVVIPVPPASARKLFLGGKCPKGAKVLVARKILDLGFPFPTSDPGDALIVGNFGRGQLGLPVLAITGWENTSKKKGKG